MKKQTRICKVMHSCIFRDTNDPQEISERLKQNIVYEGTYEQCTTWLMFNRVDFALMCDDFRDDNLTIVISSDINDFVCGISDSNHTYLSIYTIA